MLRIVKDLLKLPARNSDLWGRRAVVKRYSARFLIESAESAQLPNRPVKRNDFPPERKPRNLEVSTLRTRIHMHDELFGRRSEIQRNAVSLDAFQSRLKIMPYVRSLDTVQEQNAFQILLDCLLTRPQVLGCQSGSIAQAGGNVIRVCGITKTADGEVVKENFELHHFYV
jgi:hypothetical protein